MNKYYWWYAYGHFDQGEHNLPHIGQVIRHYRKLRQWSKEEFAEVLGNTVRYVAMLENEKNTHMPDLLSRRLALARILDIPLALLLPIQDEMGKTLTALDTPSLTMYER